RMTKICPVLAPLLLRRYLPRMSPHPHAIREGTMQQRTLRINSLNCLEQTAAKMKTDKNKITWKIYQSLAPLSLVIGDMAKRKHTTRWLLIKGNSRLVLIINTT